MAAKPNKQQIVAELLDRYGQTYCDELGVAIERNTPSALFAWLCASILFSTRISAELAAKAARAVIEHGWSSPQRLIEAGWAERTQVLNRAGYARYDESTSRMLGDTAERVLHEYKGDLRRLRERAGNEPGAERKLLQEFKGIGEVGAAIFCREAQSAWPELYPFADKKALATSQQLGLGKDAKALAGLVGRNDFPRLVAALIRTGLASDQDAVIQGAAARRG